MLTNCPCNVHWLLPQNLLSGLGRLLPPVALQIVQGHLQAFSVLLVPGKCKDVLMIKPDAIKPFYILTAKWHLKHQSDTRAFFPALIQLILPACKVIQLFNASIMTKVESHANWSLGMILSMVLDILMVWWQLKISVLHGISLHLVLCYMKEFLYMTYVRFGISWWT